MKSFNAISEKSLGFSLFRRQKQPKVKNPYSKVYKRRERQKALHFCFFKFLSVINLCQWIWVIYLWFFLSAYTFIIYSCIILTILHMSAFLIVQYIFKRGLGGHDKTFTIKWLCCLQIQDPYHQEVTFLKKITPDKKAKVDQKKKLNVAYVGLE